MLGDCQRRTTTLSGREVGIVHVVYQHCFGGFRIRHACIRYGTFMDLAHNAKRPSKYLNLRTTRKTLPASTVDVVCFVKTVVSLACVLGVSSVVSGAVVTPLLFVFAVVLVGAVVSWVVCALSVVLLPEVVAWVVCALLVVVFTLVAAWVVCALLAVLLIVVSAWVVRALFVVRSLVVAA